VLTDLSAMGARGGRPRDVSTGRSHRDILAAATATPDGSTLRAHQKDCGMFTVPAAASCGLSARCASISTSRVPYHGVFRGVGLRRQSGIPGAAHDNALVFVRAHELLHLAFAHA